MTSTMTPFRGLAAALLLLTASDAALSIDCQLACRGKDPCATVCAAPPCRLVGVDGSNVTLSAEKLQSVRACELIKSAGELEMRYRHKGRWFGPPGGVQGNTALQTVFDKYPADPCGVPSPHCLQQRMNGMVAAIGGHGIDSKQSQPGGQGDPCVLGLPCGAVLPPTPAWRFRLVDSTLSGTWTVKLARGTPPAGQPAETSARIERGAASLPGTWFVPGAQYAYRFVDDAGQKSASGEFSVISPSTRETLDALMQRRVAAGMSQGLAWSDTLGANALDWDAHQLSLSQGDAK